MPGILSFQDGVNACWGWCNKASRERLGESRAFVVLRGALSCCSRRCREQRMWGGAGPRHGGGRDRYVWRRVGPERALAVNRNGN